MSYANLRKIDVTDKIEKKGKFSYLSWAWAVDTLLQHDDQAVWEYDEPIIFQDDTMMVACSVTAFNVTRKMQLPVLNYKNQH